MFATLVIQFSSAQKGGELVVILDFGEADDTCAFSHHHALHYADAEYELKAGTAGYRLARGKLLCQLRFLIFRNTYKITPFSQY